MHLFERIEKLLSYDYNEKIETVSSRAINGKKTYEQIRY